MTPFQEHLYRLVQDAKKESNAFTSSDEDAGNETHKIVKFSQKWDFKDKYEVTLAEKEKLEAKYTRDMHQREEKITKSLIKELLPIMDEMFLLSKFADEGSPLDKGIKITLSNLEKFLHRHQGGIIRPAIGEELDPVKHQAVSAEQDPKHHGNTVSEVYRYGYFVLGKVVREAEVKVKCGVKKIIV
jgi:molecular chaperone GrpE